MSEFGNQINEYVHNRRNMYYQTASSTHDISNSSDSTQSRDWCVCGIGEGLVAQSVKVCRLPILNNVPLHIHYFWPLMILAISLSSLAVSPLYAFYTLVMGGPILFLTVLLHEIGHATMAVYLGGDVNVILLWPLGGVAYISMFGNTNPRADALIAIAGPLTHIPQVIIWLLLLYISNHEQLQFSFVLTWDNMFSQLCVGAIFIQIALFLFNLLPAVPLDGGRLLTAFLSWKNVNQSQSSKIVAIVSGSIGILMFFQSLSNIATGKNSLYLGWSSWFMSIFILSHSMTLWKKSLVTQGEVINNGTYMSLGSNDIPIDVSSRSNSTNPTFVNTVNHKPFKATGNGRIFTFSHENV